MRQSDLYITAAAIRTTAEVVGQAHGQALLEWEVSAVRVAPSRILVTQIAGTGTGLWGVGAG